MVWMTLRWRDPDSNHRSHSCERSLGCCRREMPDRFEVVVFFIIGRPLLERLSPAGAATLAAAAGLVRWSVAL